MKACTVAALSVTFFAKAQAWVTVGTYSAAGCAAGDLKSLSYSEAACTQTLCSGSSCYQKLSCNATHFQNTWYSDDSCSTVHATQNGGNPYVLDAATCSEIETGVKWMKSTCLGSAPATVSYEIFGTGDCSGASQTMTFAWQACEKKGEYQNGQWVLESEGRAVEGTSLVTKKYDSIDCTGTPTESTTIPCGQCKNFDGTGIIVDCSGGGLVGSSSRSSPGAILAAASAVLVVASRFQ